jgi:hypothetical protein
MSEKAANHTRAATASRNTSAASSIEHRSAESRSGAADAPKPLKPHTSSTGATNPATIAPRAAVAALQPCFPYGEMSARQGPEGSKVEEAKQHGMHCGRNRLERGRRRAEQRCRRECQQRVPLQREVDHATRTKAIMPLAWLEDVAVKHPVAGIVGDEGDLSARARIEQDRIRPMILP